MPRYDEFDPTTPNPKAAAAAPAGTDAMASRMEAMRRGLNMRERGITLYPSTLSIFRMLVDLAPDIHVGMVTLESRVPG